MKSLQDFMIKSEMGFCALHIVGLINSWTQHKWLLSRKGLMYCISLRLFCTCLILISSETVAKWRENIVLPNLFHSQAIKPLWNYGDWMSRTTLLVLLISLLYNALTVDILWVHVSALYSWSLFEDDFLSNTETYMPIHTYRPPLIEF